MRANGWQGSPGPRGSAPRSPIRTRCARRTWWTASSRYPPQHAGRGRLHLRQADVGASSTPRSSSTPSPGGSLAGNARPASMSGSSSVRSATPPPAGLARNPLTGSTIHHSDAGGQYTAVRCAEALIAGLKPSIGSVGDAYDNALAETTIGLYKTEAVRADSPFRHGVRSTGWPTSNCSPPNGSTGTTPSGS